MAKKQVTKRRKFQIPVNRFCRFTKAGVKEIDYKDVDLSLIHISEPTRLRRISYAVFCLKKKKKKNTKQTES